jgi:ATPase family associated with various cellular activities (AAA)
MELQLTQVFQIAKHWDAIFLLDEADVFLERRSSQDLIRNALVSVFLRKLEYCEGIMFLTTNRVSQFDDAILTRIHLMLRYEELKQAARTKIWGHFLDRACTSEGPAEIKPEELSRLATGTFNGRQVSLPIVYPESPLLIVCFRSRTSLLQHTLWPRGERAKCLSRTSERLSPRARSSSASSMVALMLLGCLCK